MLALSQQGHPQTALLPLSSEGFLKLHGESVRHYLTFCLHLSDTLILIASLARLIVYSMIPDSVPNPSSNAPTPMFTPLPSGMNTPLLRSGAAGDYLSTPMAKGSLWKNRTYLGGSKALDSLARMIASTESFFHPSNSGSWTTDVCISLDTTLKVTFYPHQICLRESSFVNSELIEVPVSLQLTAFLKFIAYDFNKRWHEEQQPDCKTPKVCTLAQIMRPS